jgi:HlyD family secretion protein
LLILGLIGGAGTAAAVPAVQYWHEKSATRYTTAEVSRGRIESSVNSTGTVKPIRTVAVGAFVSGPIEKIYVDFNSAVEKGEVIARIDQRLLKSAVDRDRAALMTQKADLARVLALLQQAKNNEARARKLRGINKDYLSDNEMDQFRFTRMSLEAQRDLTRASIAQAEATLENSLANLGYTYIQSPVSGIVIERKVDDGQTVAASFQTPELFIIAPDMDKHMHVYASVDEADIGLIRTAKELGRPANFTVDAYPQDVFQGRIDQVRNNSTTTQNVVTYPVVIEAKNPERKLMPGMTANISFLIEAKDDVLRVPVAALRFVPEIKQVHPDDRRYLDTTTEQAASGIRLSASQKAALARARSRRVVWVKEGTWLRAVPIGVGLSDNQLAEVVSGELTVGQEVVTGVEGASQQGRR